MLKQCSKLQINVKYKWPFARWKLNYEAVGAGGWAAGLQAALLMESQCSCFLEQKQNEAVF